jgi:hypothetical protein
MKGIFRVIESSRVASSREEEAFKRKHCADGERPCALLACRYHLARRGDGGAPWSRFSVEDGWEERETCALDVADEGAHDLVSLAGALNLTADRVTDVVASSLKAFIDAGGDVEGLRVLARSQR